MWDRDRCEEAVHIGSTNFQQNWNIQQKRATGHSCRWKPFVGVRRHSATSFGQLSSVAFAYLFQYFVGSLHVELAQEKQQTVDGDIGGTGATVGGLPRHLSTVAVAATNTTAAAAATASPVADTTPIVFRHRRTVRGTVRLWLTVSASRW